MFTSTAMLKYCKHLELWKVAESKINRRDCKDPVNSNLSLAGPMFTRLLVNLAIEWE